MNLMKMDSPDFIDEPFMSGKEKEVVLNAWTRFLKNGCKFNDFTDALYRHLALHCSFIAHYDRRGFYEFYFDTPGSSTIRFIDQFDPAKPGISAEIGMTYWLNGPTGADLNRAMREASAPYTSKLRELFLLDRKQRDLAQATALAAKYGMALRDGQSSPPATSLMCSDSDASESAPGQQGTLFPD
jgi:hypothetical protein